MQYLDMYLALLWRMFNFDIWVFSTQLWMYWCLLIPACFYFVFFCLKWIVLLSPILIPLKAIVRVIESFRKK
jgi:hypothetical protein